MGAAAFPPTCGTQVVLLLVSEEGGFSSLRAAQDSQVSDIIAGGQPPYRPGAVTLPMLSKENPILGSHFPSHGVEPVFKASWSPLCRLTQVNPRFSSSANLKVKACGLSSLALRRHRGSLTHSHSS